MPAEADLTGVECRQTEHGPHRRGLAGAVGPEEAGDRAGLHRERHAIEGAHRTVRAHQVIDLQHAARP
jgi:hypothetical protein